MDNDLISREDLKKSMRKSINERYISWTKTITVADIATLIFDEIEFAPTVDTYTEDDVQYAIKEGHQVGYEMAKAKFGRPKGEWITRTKDNGVNYHFYCSCCDREVIQITDYCPNCGARMTKESENE